MSDAYEYWQNAMEGRFGAVLEDQPEDGFYRIRSGPIWKPVAIWRDAGGFLNMQIGQTSIHGDDIGEHWISCAKHPIAEDDYRVAIATGQWPGEAPASREAIGANHPPEGHDALVAALKEQADELAAWLKDRKIESAADADRCETWANEFVKLKKQAEAEHKTEKAPHLEAGRKVDAKYKKLIDLAAGCAAALKRAVTPYLNARLAEKRQAASQAIARGDPAPVRAQLNATTSGASGKKIHLRTHTWAVIGDWDAALAHFKEHPEIRELVQRLADRCAAINAPVPGAEFKSEQRAA